MNDPRMRTRMFKNVGRKLSRSAITFSKNTPGTEEFCFSLADTELYFLMSGEVLPGLPSDKDFNIGLKAARNIGSTSVFETSNQVGVSDSIAIPLLSDLDKRDRDLVANMNVILPEGRLVQVISRNDNGRFERSITALIHESEGGSFTVPVRFPLDKPVFFLLSGRTLNERVRLLTEFVRIFGDIVRNLSSSNSVRSDAVRCLGQFVGLLRLAVGDECGDESGDPENDCHNVRDCWSPVHNASLSVGAVSDAAPHPTVGDAPDRTASPSGGSGALSLEQRVSALEADMRAVPALITESMHAQDLEHLMRLSTSSRRDQKSEAEVS